jgi:phosphoribosyl-dephospho-CoA transferase
MSLQRHDLVWLDSEFRYSPELKEWVMQKLPCVVTRQTNSSTDYLNIAWCNGSDKKISRHSCLIPIKSVISQSTPLSLVNIVPCFIAKSSSLTKIIRKLELLNLKPCIYGSFSWQILTKKNYTHADSDLDILLHVSMHHQLTQIVPLLNTLAVASGRRIDGELIFPDGYAVAWREWFSDSDKILCKGFRGVKFIHRNALLEQLA